ncbi:MAG: hypothetical protein Q8K73_07770 [Anaerolineales bacterium]|nr:hypothetical protein [Anaerolineales bacterium]
MIRFNHQIDYAIRVSLALSMRELEKITFDQLAEASGALNVYFRKAGQPPTRFEARKMFNKSIDLICVLHAQIFQGEHLWI